MTLANNQPKTISTWRVRDCLRILKKWVSWFSWESRVCEWHVCPKYRCSSQVGIDIDIGIGIDIDIGRGMEVFRRAPNYC